MADIKVCDICGSKIDFDNHEGLRAKQNKTFRNPYAHCWYKKWVGLDLCPSCLSCITTLCCDKEFAKQVVEQWRKEKKK